MIIIITNQLPTVWATAAYWKIRNQFLLEQLYIEKSCSLITGEFWLTWYLKDMRFIYEGITYLVSL